MKTTKKAELKKSDAKKTGSIKKGGAGRPRGPRTQESIDKFKATMAQKAANKANGHFVNGARGPGIALSPQLIDTLKAQRTGLKMGMVIAATPKQGRAANTTPIERQLKMQLAHELLQAQLSVAQTVRELLNG